MLAARSLVVILLDQAAYDQQRTLLHAALPCSSPVAGKRPFAAVTGHSLPKSTSQSKVSKDHPAARPGSGGKTASGMLVPPQLRGRCVACTVLSAGSAQRHEIAISSWPYVMPCHAEALCQVTTVPVDQASWQPVAVSWGRMYCTGHDAPD